MSTPPSHFSADLPRLAPEPAQFVFNQLKESGIYEIEKGAELLGVWMDSDGNKFIEIRIAEGSILQYKRRARFIGQRFVYLGEADFPTPTPELKEHIINGVPTYLPDHLTAITGAGELGLLAAAVHTMLPGKTDALVHDEVRIWDNSKFNTENKRVLWVEMGPDEKGDIHSFKLTCEFHNTKPVE